MNKQFYLDKATGALFAPEGKEKFLIALVDQASNDNDLTAEEKLELEQELLGGIPEEVKQKKKAPSKGLFPTYNFKDTYEPDCGLKEFGFDENCDDLPRKYAAWLRDTYLPNFLPMPDSEHQYPLLVAFILMNCNAVLSDKQDIPIVFCLGSQGSGKTEAGQLALNHHTQESSLEVLPDATGASIRDELDMRFGRGAVGMALLDNFNPTAFMNKVGASFYSVLIATNRASSVMRISGKSNEEGKREYRTYCQKWITSAFDIQSRPETEFKEIHRRCITLHFQRGTPEHSRIEYDWEGMGRIYRKIWGEEYLHEVENLYGATLGKLSRMKRKNTGIPTEMWQYCQVPIAVGVYCGLWTLEQGIKHFEQHFAYLSIKKTNTHVSTVMLALKDYVKDTLQAQAAAARGNRYATDAEKNIDKVISLDDLRERLQRTTKFTLSRRDTEEVCQLMSNLGYQTQIQNDTVVFVKEYE